MTRRGLGHKPIEYDAARLASLLSGWLSSNMPVHDHSSSLEGGDDLHALEEVEFNDAVLLTIATGIITRSQVYHQVDTEASDATDDLDTISGGTEGDLLILRAANSARTVVVKHGTGNVRFASANDYTLDDDTDHVALVFDGADWCDIGGAGATIVDHALLSATHTDTLAAGVVQGDLNVGNATPAWARLAIGANETTLRSDGTIPTWVALFDATDPVSIDVGDIAAVGTAATAPRRDHQHAVTSSSNPGAAASILATDASGFVQVLGLGIGANPPVGNRITLINNGGIQIASGVLLRFSTTPTPDQLQVYNADVYIATTAHGIIHVDGNTAGHMLRGDGTRFVPGAIQAGDLPGSFAGFANPTASVGLSAVNGSATTAMRSDAAPALSQAITPTWTGLHTFNASIAMADDTWIGIGAAAERIVFDAAGDISVMGANLGVGTLAPIGAIHAITAAVTNVHRPAYSTAPTMTLDDGTTGAITLQLAARDYSTRMCHIVMTGAPTTGDNKHWIVSHLGPDVSNRFSIGYLTSNASGFSTWADVIEHFIIATDGNSGVGCVPGVKFDVNGNSIRVRGLNLASILFASEGTTNLGAFIAYHSGHASQANRVWIKNYHADGPVILSAGGGATEHIYVGSNGRTGIMATTPLAQFHVDQPSTTAAIPVLYLDQADISEEMIEFATTIGVGNAIEAVGAKTLTTTHFIKVTLPGALTRYIPVGTIA